MNMPLTPLFSKAGFRSLILCLGLCLCAAQSLAQQIVPDEQGLVTMNMRDLDIRVLAEQVAKLSGRTLVLDPQVAGTVTILSSKPLDANGVWDLFQSVLQLNGFTAQQSGDMWRVKRLETAREGGPLPDGGSEPGRFDVVTRLIRLENFPAATAVEAFRPLIASFGYLEAVPDTNTLIVTDTAENVAKIEAIAKSLDKGGAPEVLTIRLKHADATEIGAALQGVLGPVAEGAVGPRVVVDRASNSLILRGDAETRALAQQIVADLDVKSENGSGAAPTSKVYHLKYADATAVATIVQGMVGAGAGSASAAANNPVAQSLASDAPAEGTVQTSGFGNQGAVSAEGVSVQPVVATNSIVVRAPAAMQSDIGQLVASLDTRRPQVLIEAAIVEVSGDVSEKLGTQLGFGKTTPPGGFAATSFSGAGPALSGVLSVLGVSQAQAMAASGLTIGLARADDYGILIQALGQSNKANLLSTPSLTTLDNQPAEIIVGQNVPFRTGSFNNDGTGDNPFTTIQRQDVGITMRVVPRITDGNQIQLDVSQEVSSLTDKAVNGAADLVTNRRSIKTTVIATNGGTVVLGGLMSDDRQSLRGEVPGLGRLPILGPLFRSSSSSRHKQTLYIFLRATILNSSNQMANVSNRRFQRLQSIASEVAMDPAPKKAGKPVNALPVEIDGLY